MNKILIIGAGYVGMSNGVYLSKENDVIFYDIDKEKNIRLSYRNPDILRLYSNYLKYPGSQIAKTLLHTTFKPNDTYFKKGIVKKEPYINNENIPR